MSAVYVAGSTALPMALSPRTLPVMSTVLLPYAEAKKRTG